MTDHERRLDQDVERTVIEELGWSPGIDSDLIVVDVRDGTVTLSGKVASVAQRRWAERTTARVPGVRAVDLDLSVGPLWSDTDDAELVQAAAESLRVAGDVPDSVQVSASQHVITLSGEVAWPHEREAAERAVRYGHPRHPVVNGITVHQIHDGDDRRWHLGSTRATTGSADPPWDFRPGRA